MGKTRLMIAVEAKFGEPLEELIPRLWDKSKSESGHGLSGVAAELGVSKTTLWTWCLRLRFRLDHRLMKEG